MTSQSTLRDSFAEWLTIKIGKLNQLEGRSWQNDLTVQDIAERSKIPPNNLHRWIKGGSIPTHIDHIFALAKVFSPVGGEEIFAVLHLGIDQRLAYIIAHQDNKAVMMVLEQAKAVAEQQKGGDHPFQEELVLEPVRA